MVADYLQSVFPSCERRPASLPGSDIINTPGYSIEVKARRGFDPKAWIKQSYEAATKTMDEQSLAEKQFIVPVVVMRPNGMGEATVDEWPTFMKLMDFEWMVSRIQYLEAMCSAILGEDD